MTAKSKKKNVAPKTLALVNEQGLTQSELAAAVAIGQAAPAIVAAFADYRRAEGEFASRFWTLAETLRLPVAKVGPTGSLPALRLNGREVSLLLLSLGEIKQRVTEWKKVVEMDDDTYQKCRLAGFSKVETLGVARGSLAIEGEGEDAEAVPVKKPDTETKKPTKAKFHKLSKELAQLFHAIIQGDTDSPGVKATNDNVPFELEGTLADGRVYALRLFVDSKPVKPVAE